MFGWLIGLGESFVGIEVAIAWRRVFRLAIVAGTRPPSGRRRLPGDTAEQRSVRRFSKSLKINK
jgi:hypothetical protein